MTKTPKTESTALATTAPAPSDDGVDDAWSFTDEERDALAAEISNEDLRARMQELNDAQEKWERVAYKAVAKIPCPECSGAGQISGGVLGDLCVNCMGKRVVDDPDADEFAMPNFGKWRAALAAYGAAMDDRLLPAGFKDAEGNFQRVRQGIVMPTADSVPSMSSIVALSARAKDVSRQLSAAPRAPAPQLAAPKPAKGLAGEGDLGEYADGELDEMITDAEEV